jgi:hypothetical protein
MRDVIPVFNERGLGALAPEWSGGRPLAISDEVREHILLIAGTVPAGASRHSTWSPRTPAKHFIHHRVPQASHVDRTNWLNSADHTAVYGRLDPIVLVVEAPAPAVMTAEWSATSTSMDGTVSGQLPIPIADEPLPLAAVLTEPEAWRQRRSRTR